MKLKKNKREQQVQQEYLSQGYMVFYRGWPDFLCYNPDTGHICCLEVKRKQRHKTTKMGLSDYQRQVHRILRKAGLEVYTIYID